MEKLDILLLLNAISFFTYIAVVWITGEQYNPLLIVCFFTEAIFIITYFRLLITETKRIE